MKDTIIYIRKSREDLENKEDTLKNHTDILTRLCEKNNWKFSLYAEVGTSDSIESRTEIKKVISEIEKGNVCRLVVMALDRLSRNTYDSAFIQKILVDHNVTVVTPQKTYDYSNDSDLMLSDFERLIAAQEYRVIKKRLAIGKQIGAENGRMVTGEPPIGYYLAKEGIISLADCKNEVTKLNDRKKDVQTSLSVLIYKYENMSKDVEKELIHFKDVYEQLNTTASEEDYNILIRENINKIVVTRSGENKDEVSMDISFL